MTTPVSRKAIFVSLLGHLAVFSIFSLSFGARLPNADFASIFFLGKCLRNSQVEPIIAPAAKIAKSLPLAAKPDTHSLNQKSQDLLSFPYQIKPATVVPFNAEKATYVDEPATFVFTPRKREPTVVLHPLLPYSFALYFRDRQIAHVELMFNITSSGEKSLISLKRKISSGNLEVDLLTLRYISHYLFVQHANFTPDNWQSVKIDLSARE